MTSILIALVTILIGCYLVNLGDPNRSPWSSPCWGLALRVVSTVVGLAAVIVGFARLFIEVLG